MTPEQIEREKKLIQNLSQVEMARLHRFAHAGHKYFNNENQEVSNFFQEEFNRKGGMTPEISKRIGWDV